MVTYRNVTGQGRPKSPFKETDTTIMNYNKNARTTSTYSKSMIKMSKKQQNKLISVIDKLVSQAVDKNKYNERNSSRKNKIKIKQFETQMGFSDILKIPSNVVNISEKLGDITENFGDISDNVKEAISLAISKISNASSSINNAITRVLQLTPLIFAFYRMGAVIYLIINGKYNQALHEVKYIIAMIAATEISCAVMGSLSPIKALIRTWTELIVPLLNSRFQFSAQNESKEVNDEFIKLSDLYSDDNSIINDVNKLSKRKVQTDTSEQQVPDDWSDTDKFHTQSAFSSDYLISNLSNIISSSIVYLTVNKDSKTLFNKDLVYGLSTFPRLKSGITEILNWIFEVMMCTIKNIDQSFFGYDVVQDINEFQPQLDDWANKVIFLHESNKKKPFEVTNVNYDILYNVYNQGCKLQLVHTKIADLPHIRSLFSSMLSTMKVLMKPFELANFSGYGPRMEPVTIMLRGAPGVGKSYMLYPFIKHVLVNVLPEQLKEDLKSRPSDYVYVRNPEQKYWDGYRGQFATLMDDFGQVRDTAGREDSEYMDIIRASNMFPFVLHMASLEDKGNTIFNSKLIVATSNLPNKITPQSIVEPSAVKRRFHINYRIVPAVRFCTKSSLGGNISDRKLNKEHSDIVDGAFNFQIYEFHELNENEEYTGVVLNYDKFVALVVQEYKKREATSIAFLKNLEEMDLCIIKQNFENMETQSGPTSLTRANIVAKRASALLHYDVHTCSSLIQEFSRNVYVSENHCGPLLCFMNQISLALSSGVVHVEDLERARKVVQSLIASWHIENPVQQLTMQSLDNYVQDLLSEITADELRDNLLDAFDESIINKYKDCDYLMPQFLKANLSLTDKIKNFAKKIDQFPMFSALKVALPAFTAIGAFYFLFKKMTSKHNDDIEDKSSDNPLVCSDREELEFSSLPWKDSGVKIPDHSLEKAIAQMDSGQNSRNKGPRIIIKSAKSRHINNLSRPVQNVFQGYSDGNCDQLIASIIKNNYYEMSYDDGKKIGSCLFISGRLLLVNAHYLLHFTETIMLNNNAKLHIHNIINNRHFIVPLTEIMNKCQIQSQSDIDVAIICLPDYIMPHRNIINNFITRAQQIKIESFEAKMINLYGNNITTCILNAESIFELDIVHNGTTGDTIQYRIARGYDYWGYSDEGACGSLMLVYNRAMGPGKIAGFHVSGMSNGRGMSSAICADDLYDLITNFSDLPSTQSRPLSKVIDTTKWVNNTFDRSFPLVGNFESLGTIEGCVSTPNKSAIVPSALYEKWGPALTKPTNILYIKQNKDTINVRTLALEEYGVVDIDIDMNEMNQVVRATFNTIFKRSKINNVDMLKPRVFTFEEAVLGVSEFTIPSLNRVSSPGYPWTTFRGHNSKGKTQWFGSDIDFDLSNEHCRILKQTTEWQEQLILGGKRPLFIFTDTAKDERRAIDKVNAGKVRMFSAAPLDYTILFRRFFLSFMIFMQENRISNGCAVGINVYSSDWDFLAKNLESKSYKYIAGDFSKFDKRQFALVLKTFVNYINDWYNDEFSLVREILWEEVFNSIHLYENHVYQWFHALPSGHPMTVFINCIYNLVIIQYVYCKSHPDGFNCGLVSFPLNVHPIVYGDDNVIGVSKVVGNWFNQKTMTQGVERYFNMQYTSEDKVENDQTTLLRKISEISFLKRKFSFDPSLNMYIAPLNLQVVLEIPYWTKRGLDYHIITETNISNTISELSLHGKEIYEYWFKKISVAVIKYNLKMPYVTEYSSVLHETLSRVQYW